MAPSNLNITIPGALLLPTWIPPVVDRAADYATYAVGILREKMVRLAATMGIEARLAVPNPEPNPEPNPGRAFAVSKGRHPSRSHPSRKRPRNPMSSWEARTEQTIKTAKRIGSPNPNPKHLSRNPARDQTLKWRTQRNRKTRRNPMNQMNQMNRKMQMMQGTQRKRRHPAPARRLIVTTENSDIERMGLRGNRYPLPAQRPRRLRIT
ncbi:hypothetical protein F5X99DRAFT_398101 [Biscogniauxia marginata]|nr:hypothetical protein F5X99DRAFT_398101 [Biscogniauxia marginata]